jgi:hypothetical protein
MYSLGYSTIVFVGSALLMDMFAVNIPKWKTRTCP